MPLLAAAVAAALGLGAVPSAPVAALSLARVPPVPDLALHFAAAALDGSHIVTRSPPARDAPAPAPPCIGDVCQPVVAVPGFEPHFERVHRSELFVLALERAHVEPLAHVAWALVATGLRVDWSPPSLDGPGADRHGWGSVMLRLRLRLDATNHLVFPRRPLPARSSRRGRARRGRVGRRARPG